eukprot:scaffold5455_cov49-Phaeocystis_antarctica.AAC.1
MPLLVLVLDALVRRRRCTLSALAAAPALAALAAQRRQAEEQAVLRLQRHIEALGGRRAACLGVRVGVGVRVRVGVGVRVRAAVRCRARARSGAARVRAARGARAPPPPPGGSRRTCGGPARRPVAYSRARLAAVLAELAAAEPSRVEARRLREADRVVAEADLSRVE